MAYLDEAAMLELWERIDAVFSRLSESGASVGVYGQTITLYNANGAAISSATLPSTDTSSLISESTANSRFGTHMDVSGGYLRLINANGAVIGRVALSELR